MIYHISKYPNREEKIDNKFSELITSINDNIFWKYVKSWFDEQYILEIMSEWDTETKEQAIKDIKKLLKGGSNKNG